MRESEEKPVRIPGPFPLAGRLREGAGPEGLVVTHPHPLYGGSMDNNVVQAVGRAGARAGMSVLRFNFRGVAGSEGSHDRGRGERDDLLAALDFMAGLGSASPWVAGYSFGAWVAAVTPLGARRSAGRIWVAPPVGMMPLKPSQVESPPDLILYGSEDPFCPQPVIEALARKLGPEVSLKRLDGADHFFSGRETELSRLVNRYLADRNRGAG